MKYTNYKKIDSIEFLYPELMAKDAPEKISSLFERIQLAKETLSETSMLAEELRAQLSKYEKEWESISHLVRVTFKVEEKEEIKNSVNLGFNFGTDINKNIH